MVLNLPMTCDSNRASKSVKPLYDTFNAINCSEGLRGGDDVALCGVK